MKIFSTYRKMEPRRRFGSMEFRNKIKTAANYKRVFNPAGLFSLRVFPTGKYWLFAKIAAIAIILLLGYFFFISPKLLITDVSVKGNVQVSTQQIQDVLAASGNSRLFFIKKSNFFLMTQGRMNQLLKSNIPTIKDVSLSKSWPNKATIEVSEHTPGFVIESSGRYFLVDDEGAVVSQVTDTKKLLIAHDQVMEDFAREEVLPNQKLAPFILSMNKLWSSKVSVAIASVKFPGKSGADAQFVTTEGWEVLFDTGRSVSVQLSSLAVMLSKQINLSDRPNLAYIDLRLSKWVYYCFKATACEQKEQPVEAGTTIDVKP